ncbi:hypothetical protein JVU11DRAFT_307 [Chiua virens]|nr:hypothetical protein JVU11DRAFT_307 [Chiua virens]
MAGRKRAAVEDISEKRETRSSKVAKTEGHKATGKAAKGAARLKTSMAQSTFKSRATPLYVSISTTAPVAEGEGEETAPADPGFLASTTLVPSTFATGSFGWKGHKRMVVELPKTEGEGEGEGEKVHVMLTINATVIGSKDVKEGEEHEGDTEGTGEQPVTKEVTTEAVGTKEGESPETDAKEGGDNPPAASVEQAEEIAS